MILEKKKAKKRGYIAICQCNTCQKIFERNYSLVMGSSSHFCNATCWSRFAVLQRKNVDAKCVRCGNTLINVNKKRKYCEDCNKQINKEQHIADYIKHKEKRDSNNIKNYYKNYVYYRDYQNKKTELERFGGERKDILAFFNNVCGICGSNQKLVIHHIDGVGRNSISPNNDINNLMVLCRGCHMSIHKVSALV